MKNIWDTTKDLSKGIKDKASDIHQNSTGKNLEKSVNEYSEVYGEIILGMDRKLEKNEKRLKEFDENLKDRMTEIDRIREVTLEQNEKSQKDIDEKIEKFILEWRKEYSEFIKTRNRIISENEKAKNEIKTQFMKIEEITRALKIKNSKKYDAFSITAILFASASIIISIL